MTKSFNTFNSRKDKDLAGFGSPSCSVKELLSDICCNAHTGYVVQKGDYVMVPKFQQENIKSHLISRGWVEG